MMFMMVYWGTDGDSCHCNGIRTVGDNSIIIGYDAFGKTADYVGLGSTALAKTLAITFRPLGKMYF